MKKLITILTLSLISSLGFGFDLSNVHQEFLANPSITQNVKWKQGQTLYYRQQFFSEDSSESILTIVKAKLETPVGFWILVTTFSSIDTEKPTFTSEAHISKEDGRVLELKINGQPAPVPTFPKIDVTILEKTQTSVDVAGKNYPNATFTKMATGDIVAETWEVPEIPMPIRTLVYIKGKLIHSSELVSFNSGT